MKSVGGTRQEGGWQDHTPTSCPCVGPTIHSLWTEDGDIQ